MNNKLEEMLTSARLNELLHKKEIEEKQKSNIVTILAIIGIITAVAAIAYGVYKYFILDEFDDEFDDDFDDDFVEFGPEEA